MPQLSKKKPIFEMLIGNSLFFLSHDKLKYDVHVRSTSSKNGY